MPMYTQLLEAAFALRPPPGAGPTDRSALDEVIRWRRELEKEVAPRLDGDSFPVALEWQISYDVALLELARAVDVETEPNRFEQPQPEREVWSVPSRPRDQPGGERRRGSRAAPLLRVDEAQVPVASERASFSARLDERAEHDACTDAT
jgi:hypothetical protein